MTEGVIRELLNDLESDNVERTVSTTDTNKFGQAICAFANDLPGNNRPGYLIIGAEDDGKIHPIHVTDELLKNIAAIRTDGNIQPQPSMSVQKISLAEGNIIVVKVYPAKFPPVRYKGRVWVRVGPRKGIANEDDERRLYEKRAAHVFTFDAMPCVGATVDDLDIAVFKQQYLPRAVPEDVLREDRRDVKLQLQSLGFFDQRCDCPTYAGILFFGKEVERYLPGAYIQYVRFGGKGRAGEIMNEYKFTGNLCKVLFQLDTFVDTSITNRRPVPVSALREKTIVDYPHWATRELLMNAICHRTYESNGPIQFYQYDDRIELMNPGGLYGKANIENFPLVNDYRNPIVAEAMKVLGFVNRFSRGVMRVKEELRENGNGDPVFDLDLGTAFMVIEPISTKKHPRKNTPEGKNKKKNEGKNEGKETTKSEGKNTIEKQIGGYEHIDILREANAYENYTTKQKNTTEGKRERKNEGKNTTERKNERKNTPKNEGKEKPLTEKEKNILNILSQKPTATYPFIAQKLNIGETSVYNMIKKLKDTGWIKRQQGRKYGKWILLKNTKQK